MATVKFIRKGGRSHPEKEAVIYAQYSHNERTALFSTGKKVLAKHWDFQRGQALEGKKGLSHASDLNQGFAQFKQEILGIATKVENQGLEPEVERVKKGYEESITENRPEFVLTLTMGLMWTQFIEGRKSKLAPRTLASETNSKQALEAFLVHKKAKDLLTERFTLKHLEQFEQWLAEPKKADPRKNETKKSDSENRQRPGSNPNTIAKRVKHLKAFLRWHEKHGGLLSIDLDKVIYKEKPGTKVSLTETELEAVRTFNLSGRRAHVRDMFVLQCMTGLRISDLKRLDESLEGGKIRIVTQKTATELQIPISPAVREILQRYDYALPRIPDQTINEEIKLIVKEACPQSTVQVREGKVSRKVTKWSVITSHDAIRTFITLSADRGMSVPALAKITGKTVAVLLKHYLDNSQKVAESEFEKAWGASPLRIAK